MKYIWWKMESENTKRRVKSKKEFELCLDLLYSISECVDTVLQLYISIISSLENIKYQMVLVK